MKTIRQYAVAVLIMLTSLLSHASIKAETLMTDCKAYVQAQDNGKPNYDSKAQEDSSNICIGFVSGYMEEAAGELILDKAHNRLQTCDWQNVNTNQVIRVFVKFVDATPELLNKEAVVVLWASSIKAGAYACTPIPVQPTDN